jgi:anaerobic selenocysteine-containing dehydrogenase
VIDPKRIPLADKADLYLRVRPGADGALALAMTHVIVEEKLYDAEFLEKWTVGFKYSPDLQMPGTLTLNGSWLYHSFFYNNLSNELDLVQAHEASVYNASISWVDDQGRWRVSLEGRNLSDKHYVVNAVQQASPTAPAVTGYPNAPRTYGLRVGVQF